MRRSRALYPVAPARALFAAFVLVATLATPAIADVPARRVITLAPHLAEMVFATGAEAALVGTVEYSDYPAAARAIPRVGDAFRLDRERIMSLRPDLVLAWDGGTPVAVIEQLRGDGHAVAVIGGDTLGSVADALEQIGRLTGSETTASLQAARYRDELAVLRERYHRAAILPTFFQISEQPLYTVTGQQIISQAIDLCGGRNVFADLPGLVAQVSAEAVVAADPRVMLATAGAGDDPLARWRRFQDLAAVSAGHLYLVDGDLVSRPGPRLLIGVSQICESLEASRGRSDG